MLDSYRSSGFPDRNAEYFFYQTLVGAWPLPFERLWAAIQKSVREAKQYTSWAEPNQSYEAALERFIRCALADHDFVADLESFLSPLIEPAQINSLAQTLVKLTAPGVPDIYQGTELWEFSLVDPDNRRPVDFQLRRELLKEVQSLTVEQAWSRRAEGVPKLWLLQRVLSFRARNPNLFSASASYESLVVNGQKRDHAITFVRGGKTITIVPRLSIMLENNWLDTNVILPAGEWRSELTTQTYRAGPLLLGEALSLFPVALLSRTLGT
jgi:(1->4)-alpha-D-glucan 1-alpha-D-glucosylmutase